MGRLSAEDMVEWGGTGDAALNWHLTCNHFPPIIDGVRFARMAMEAVLDGRGDEPVIDRDSQRYAPSAWDVIESWHLDPFLAQEGDDDDGIA